MQLRRKWAAIGRTFVFGRENRVVRSPVSPTAVASIEAQLAGC